LYIKLLRVTVKNYSAIAKLVFSLREETPANNWNNWKYYFQPYLFRKFYLFTKLYLFRKIYLFRDL